MSWLRKLFPREFKQRYDPGPIRSVTPVVGERWELKPSGDPFPLIECIATIRDVRNGWVRYSINDVFNDNRKEVTDFLAVYRRIGNEIIPEEKVF